MQFFLRSMMVPLLSSSDINKRFFFSSLYDLRQTLFITGILFTIKDIISSKLLFKTTKTYMAQKASDGLLNVRVQWQRQQQIIIFFLFFIIFNNLDAHCYCEKLLGKTVIPSFFVTDVMLMRYIRFFHRRAHKQEANMNYIFTIANG